MQMTIDFPGGARVDASFGPFTVATDQPPEASAPTPFSLFLASVGTCAGIYVLDFLRQRNLSTDGLRLVERVVRGADGMVARIDIDVQLPEGFPEKYREAVVRAADQCTVKKHLVRPPDIVIRAHAAAPHPVAMP
jgi:ribosomal protein S12 methylthiotransferase accessory factor